MSDDIIKYPAQLPHPLQQGYAFETTNPKLSTPMASGYVRERRRTQSVPTRAKVTWNMDSQQAAFFEAWFARTLVDGTKWFEAMLQTPLGFLPYTCRILGMYEGAELVRSGAGSTARRSNCANAPDAARLGGVPGLLVQHEHIGPCDEPRWSLAGGMRWTHSKLPSPRRPTRC